MGVNESKRKNHLINRDLNLTASISKMKKTIITISTLLAMSLANPVDIHNNHESGRQFSSSNLGGYASSFYHSVLGHSDPKTVECKIYYKYAKKIYYESKEVKHCHDEPSVECEDLMKICHEEPEEVCGVKIEKECKNEPEQVCENKIEKQCKNVPKEICEEVEISTDARQDVLYDAIFENTEDYYDDDQLEKEKKCHTEDEEVCEDKEMKDCHWEEHEVCEDKEFKYCHEEHNEVCEESNMKNCHVEHHDVCKSRLIKVPRIEKIKIPFKRCRSSYHHNH